MVEYIDACKQLRLPGGGRGVEVKPPDINLSDIAFTVVYGPDETHTPDTGHIRFGLSAIKGVGEKAMAVVIDERTKNGPFKGLYDFCERVDLRACNKSTLEALIKAGAFDSMYCLEERAALIAAMEGAMKGGQRAAADKAAGQLGMFGMGLAADDAPQDEAPAAEPALPSTTAWTKKETLDFEKAVMGLYASSHPLQDHAAALDQFSQSSIEDVYGLPAGQELVIGGMLSRVRPTLVKNGRSAGSKMAMLTLEDASGNKVDAVCFADTYATNANYLETDAVVFLKGKVDRRREEPNIIVDRVIPADQAKTILTRVVRVIVEEQPGTALNGESAGQLNQLKEVLRQAAQRGRGTATAQVLLELRQQDAAVELRLNGVNVAADDLLIEGIQTVMGRLPGRSARCELTGAPKINRGRSIERHGEVKRDGELVFAMHDDGGQSIDRY